MEITATNLVEKENVCHPDRECASVWVSELDDYEVTWEATRRHIHKDAQEDSKRTLERQGYQKDLVRPAPQTNWKDTH